MNRNGYQKMSLEGSKFHMIETNATDDEWGHLLALLPPDQSTEAKNAKDSAGHYEDDGLRLPIPNSYGREDLLNPFWHNCPTCCLPARSSTERPRKRRMKCCDNCKKIQNMAKFIPRKDFLQFNFSDSDCFGDSKGKRNNQQRQRNLFLRVSERNASQIVRIISGQRMHEIASTREVIHGDELMFHYHFNEMGGIGASMEETDTRPIVRFRAVKKNYDGDMTTSNLGEVASGTNEDYDEKKYTMRSVRGATTMEVDTTNAVQNGRKIEVPNPYPGSVKEKIVEISNLDNTDTSKQQEESLMEKNEKTESDTLAVTNSNARKDHCDNTVRVKDNDNCNSNDGGKLMCESESEEDESEPLTLPSNFFPSYSCNDSPERSVTNSQIHLNHNIGFDNITTDIVNSKNTSRVVENTVTPHDSNLCPSQRKSREMNNHGVKLDEDMHEVLHTKNLNQPHNEELLETKVVSSTVNDDAVVSKPDSSSNHAQFRDECDDNTMQLISTLSRDQLIELRNREGNHSLRHSVISLTLALTSGASSWDTVFMRDSSHVNGGDIRTRENEKDYTNLNGNRWMPRLLRGTKILIDKKSI